MVSLSEKVTENLQLKNFIYSRNETKSVDEWLSWLLAGWAVRLLPDHGVTRDDRSNIKNNDALQGFLNIGVNKWHESERSLCAPLMSSKLTQILVAVWSASRWSDGKGENDRSTVLLRDAHHFGRV